MLDINLMERYPRLGDLVGLEETVPGTLVYTKQNPADAEEIQQLASAQGGAATLFKVTDNNLEFSERFAPLQAKIKQFHVNLKMRFDPYGILNYGRLYSDL